MSMPHPIRSRPRKPSFAGIPESEDEASEWRWSNLARMCRCKSAPEVRQTPRSDVALLPLSGESVRECGAGVSVLYSFMMYRSVIKTHIFNFCLHAKNTHSSRFSARSNVFVYIGVNCVE